MLMVASEYVVRDVCMCACAILYFFIYFVSHDAILMNKRVLFRSKKSQGPKTQRLTAQIRLAQANSFMGCFHRIVRPEAIGF